MAKIKDGALLGKFGNLVGCKVRDTYYVRKAPERTSPRTEGELLSENNFRMIISWLKPIAPFVKQGFKNPRAGRTERGTATGILLEQQAGAQQQSSRPDHDAGLQHRKEDRTVRSEWSQENCRPGHPASARTGFWDLSHLCGLCYRGCQEAVGQRLSGFS